MKLISEIIGANQFAQTKLASSGKRLSRIALAIALCSLPSLSHAASPLKVGSEFLVNTHTPEEQSSPSAGRLNDGHFLIAWESQKQDGSESGIYAQRYDASGSPLGSEFRVNSMTSGFQMGPQVATLHDGSFVVAWETNGADGTGIAAQHFNADGTRAGGEITLYKNATRIVSSMSISTLANGGYLIGWVEFSSNYSSSEAFVRTFNNRGVVQTPQLIRKSGARLPSIVETSDNGFFMIASSKSDGRLIGQRYDVNGNIKGSEFYISTTSDFKDYDYSLSRLSNGEFVAVWTNSGRDGDGSGVYARHFDTNGVAKGPDFLVNTVTRGQQNKPTIKALDNGGYLVSWYEDSTQRGISVQAFNNDGSRNGEVFLANTSTDGTPYDPTISTINDSEFVISWARQSTAKDTNVYAQRFQLEAVQANTMTITLPQTSVLEGDVVTLPLQISGADIYGLDAIVSLSDTTKARVSGGEYGEFLPSDERLSVPMGINDNQWDGALALMAPATAKSGEGNFATVTLIAEQAGTVNLTVQAQMTDQQGNYLNQSNTDYTLSIEESVTLTGNVANLGIAGDFIYVTLFINGQRVTINPDGSFSMRVGLGEVTMSLTAPGHLTAEKQITLATGQADIDFGQINLIGGDSNGDNLIDIADLTQLLGAYRSVDGQQNGYVMAADFNRDGAINLQDLTLLGANFGKQGPQSW
ncbi:hypothetical protein PRUB_a2510 [Pseudoalteromonas rubra]|uniref:Dockerin domain-containing protein n=1 Tax=Pseudoalteromonas rubra TaxID=43658 RepID=A0A8T0CD84_9GAMM|nr:dockerin type I domain-containing protein [Pseudoalteromonas rubra]KAF7787971.1 hypothetical protein PRUB_a2510 [Pseudoalteromonas rubra]